MSITDEEFFNENIVSVNKMVEKILFAAAIVPVLFIILSMARIWVVPHKYSLFVLTITLVNALIVFLLNRTVKCQIISMYYGLFATTVFVFLLGYKGIILVTVSYAAPPFISCLYYNKVLTNITTVLNLLSATIAYRIRSYSVTLVKTGIQSADEWFTVNILGILIEFVFVFIITYFLSKRTRRTLTKLVNSQDDRDKAYERLKENNLTIIKINAELGEKNHELSYAQYKIIQFIAQVLGSHDLFTGRHVMHTRKYVEIIAKQLRQEGYFQEELTDKKIELYETAAFLHDIGKIHIPEGVLNKIGKFTPEEFELMKCHPLEGKKLLEFLPPIDDGEFNEIAQQMALCHHEKWDGTGYPNHLSGKEIPLCARIMAAADVLDALISQRLYKDPVSIDEAMEIFKKSSGLHFEPCIAKAVIHCKSLIEIIDNDFKTSEASTNAEELEWWMKYHKNLNEQ